jgi:hypothetical protein
MVTAGYSPIKRLITGSIFRAIIGRLYPIITEITSIGCNLRILVKRIIKSHSLFPRGWLSYARKIRDLLMDAIGFEPTTTFCWQTNLRYVAQSVFHTQQSIYNHFS